MLVIENGWRIREERTVPEIGAAPIEDVNGFSETVGRVLRSNRPLEIKAEGAGRLVLPVDDNNVGKASVRSSDLWGDGIGQLSR